MSSAPRQLTLSDTSDSDDWSPLFDENFLLKHVGRIMTDPLFAIVELVANCWDAGATEVRITWPLTNGDEFCIEDNGISMTKPEFRRRWRNLSYNRIKEQGTDVKFPKNLKKKRKAFGKNGIGRHAMFCFSDEYFIEIKKDGKLLEASIKQTNGENCFDIDITNQSTTDKQGTKLWCKASRNISSLSSNELLDFIGSRFIADPEFKTYVNDDLVSFEHLTAFSEELNVFLDSGEKIIVRRFDSEKAGRTSKQSGIAYWVNNKLVGMPNWEGYDGSLLDARHTEARRYTYVIDASILDRENAVKQDWSGFHASTLVNELKMKVSLAIRDDLIGLTSDLRAKNKEKALAANRGTIAKLPLLSKEHIAKFADEIQLSCPTLKSNDRQFKSEVQHLKVFP
jgi:Histidine kinase-, DNA gyrase B-, and HSP90-like ATPase